jgi:cardiolipin synthase C
MGVLRNVILTLAALLTGGCAALPPRGDVPVAQALRAEDTAATRLGRVAAASVPPDAAGPDGFRLLPTGEYAFDARAALGEAAERSIDAQYYHVHDDTAGVAFLRALRDAARRGVRVRLLVDDFYAGEVYQLLIALNTEPHAEVRTFNPLLHRWGSPLMRLLKSWPEFDRVNRRMHNKLFVADNQVAIYGGRNVADEYFMRSGEANFVDLDILAVGPQVKALSAAFDAYWNSEHAWPVDRVPGSGRRHEYERTLFERRTAELPLQMEMAPRDPLGQTSVRAQLSEGVLRMRWGHASVQADPPGKITEPVVLNQPSAAMRAKLELIGRAESEVIIVNPYFLPGEVGMGMMAAAAKRGIRGLIFTNSLASTDVPLVHRAYARYRVAMARLGMQLLELNPGQLQRSGDYGNFGRSVARLHVKAAAIDRRWLLVGSVNLDGRSAILNTELSVNIDCPPLVADAIAALGAPPWRTMFSLNLADDGQTLRWREIEADGRIRTHDDEPHDDAWQRLVHWFQSLLVREEQL